MKQVMKGKAPKAPFSFRRNVLPPLAGMLVLLGTLGLLNEQWVVAQLQFRFIHTPIPTIAEASAAPVDPNAPATISIPKIDVNAPIVLDTKGTDSGSVQLALRRGVLHYGDTAYPGEVGNVALFGHSSGVAWEPGSYKFVFTLLNRVQKNDLIIVTYQGKRYVYRVTDTTVVPPTDMSVVQQTDFPELSVITCTPVGTSKNRLVVHAKQVFPKPETAKPSSATGTVSAGQLPE